tara:strand:- start:198 stop:521 length:324 start_codon:yes stop_codon:yes gene_type:complete
MLPNMNKMLKQAKDMQDKMSKIKEELGNMEIEGKSGGGMVKAVVNGNKDMISIEIKDEVLTEEKDFIEDLIVSAVNQALQNASEESEKKMSSVTGGMLGNMKIPGLS